MAGLSKKTSRQEPLLLGIVGDSGSGKSTLIRGIVNLFGSENITEICLDDYHRYDRATRADLGLTALNPAANDLELMVSQIGELRANQAIFKPVYDHSTGTFAPWEWVTPGRVVLVHGLFTLFTPELASLFDLGVYLDPEPELRLNWKIRRDTLKRGYSLAEVLRQVEERRPDAAAYIEPQQHRADLVVSFGLPDPATPDVLQANLYRSAKAAGGKLAQWAIPPLEYCRQTQGEYLHIPADLDNIQALHLEKYWQSNFEGAFDDLLAGRDYQPVALLNQLSSSETGFYQSAEGEWKRSFSLSLTQLLIAGSLTPERGPARLVA